MQTLLLWGAVICLLVIENRGEKMLGAGKWTVKTVQRCEKDADMVWKVDVRRHRLNRTYDSFDIDVVLLDQLDNSYAVRIDICKVVDGGCKPYMTLKDDCLINFVKKYADNNVDEILAAGGVDPPQFPVSKGDYHINQYMVNCDDFPKDGIYGEYEVEGNIVKDGVDIACCKIFVKYTPVDDYDPNPSRFG